MKTQELRIGNKIIDPKYPDLISEIKQLHSEYVVTSHSDSISCELIEAILITPEILAKFGFELDNETEYRCHYSHPTHRIYFSFHKQYKEENTLAIMGISIPDWAQPKYLHQLENLYFSLTGAELMPRYQI
jgi:hypothetical protein